MTLTVQLTAITTALRTAADEPTALGILAPLTRAQLRTIAEQTGVAVLASATGTSMRGTIAYHLVGRRLDRAAILGQ